MKISEIKQIRHIEGAVLGKPRSPKKKRIRGTTSPKAPKERKGRIDRARFQCNGGKLLGGMSSPAHDIFMKQGDALTKQEFGISDKRIIIPSFHTTGKLFAQHF